MYSSELFGLFFGCFFFCSFFVSFFSFTAAGAFSFFVVAAAVAFVVVAVARDTVATAFVVVAEQIVIVVIAAIAAGAHVFLVLLNKEICSSADSSQRAEHENYLDKSGTDVGLLRFFGFRHPEHYCFLRNF